MAAVANRQEPLLRFGASAYAGVTLIGAASGAVAAVLTSVSPIGGALCGAAAYFSTGLIVDLTRNINIPQSESHMLDTIGRVLNAILKLGISIGIGASVGMGLAGLAGYAVSVYTAAGTYAGVYTIIAISGMFGD